MSTGSCPWEQNLGGNRETGVPAAEGVIPVNHRVTEIPENWPPWPPRENRRKLGPNTGKSSKFTLKLGDTPYTMEKMVDFR